MDAPAEQKKTGFRIVHKGLAVILIPVVLQLACILWLYLLVAKTERLAAVEEALAGASDMTADLLVDFGYLVSSRINEFSNGEQPSRQLAGDRQKILELHARGNQLLEQCKAVGVSESLTQTMSSCMRDSLDGLYRVLLASDKIAESDPSFVNRINLLQQLQPKATKLQNAMLRLRAAGAQLRAELEHARHAQSIARAQMKTQIFAAVCIEVAMTIVSLLLFLKNIADRLKILIANARLIPKEQPLLQTVSGNDELAYLDKVLHDASVSLHRAAEHKRSLMRMVAHDLRSPLMSAQLSTEQLIANAKDDDSKLIPRLEDLQHTCSLLIGFVEDLLTVDKLEAGKLQLDWDSVEVSEVVHESLQQLSRLAQDKNITIQEQIQPGRALADHRRLLQVLNNLVSNAIKYSPEGADVIISSGVENGQMKISVRDNGPGIEANKQMSLFDQYYQTDQTHSSQGFGLGLAICKLIISEHNGLIGVDSTPGKGSAFWFTLPLDEDWGAEADGEKLEVETMQKDAAAG